MKPVHMAEQTFTVMAAPAGKVEAPAGRVLSAAQSMPSLVLPLEQ